MFLTQRGLKPLIIAALIGLILLAPTCYKKSHELPTHQPPLGIDYFNKPFPKKSDAPAKSDLHQLPTHQPPLGIDYFNKLFTKKLDAQARSDLHKFYLVCKGYWAENGGDKECNIDIAYDPKIGFRPSRQISVKGNGTKQNFTATAQPRGHTKVFSIDAKGKITKVESQ
jgi:hypothetical protein